MRLTILSVAYPFAPAGPDAVGGAEQVLSLLDESLMEAGHRSIVVAQEGSKPKGILVPTPRCEGIVDEAARRVAHTQHRRAIAEAMGRWSADLVHMHGHDFNYYLPPVGVPVIATLHGPPDWYARDVFNLTRPATYLHCVSRTQRLACPRGCSLLPDIENGVKFEAPSWPVRKRNFAFALGRICPQKGFDIALDAAKLANIPLLIAGETFPYEDHQRYSRDEVVPRLTRSRRFIGPANVRRKRRLMSAARCLLVPSLVAETSSLVAMEALACGTPVIAYPSGALAQIVEHGRTGFLVRDEYEMARAIEEVPRIKAEDCRQAWRERFSAARMVRQYFVMYDDVILKCGLHDGSGLSASTGPQRAHEDGAQKRLPQSESVS